MRAHPSHLGVSGSRLLQGKGGWTVVSTMVTDDPDQLVWCDTIGMTGKWSLIFDLSSPEGSSVIVVLTKSCALLYMQQAKFIVRLCPGTLMAKINIKAANTCPPKRLLVVGDEVQRIGFYGHSTTVRNTQHLQCSGRRP